MVADDDRGRITALIDWECAAWLPDYWEYSKVVNWNYGEDRKFKERVSVFLEKHEMEAKANRRLSEMYGDAYLGFTSRFLGKRLSSKSRY